MKTNLSLRSSGMKNVSRNMKPGSQATITTISTISSDNDILVKVNLNEDIGKSYLIITNLSSAVIGKLKQLEKFYFKVRINKIEDKYTDFIPTTYELFWNRNDSIFTNLFFQAENNFTDKSDIQFIEEIQFFYLFYESYKVNALNIYDSDKKTIIFSYMSQS